MKTLAILATALITTSSAHALITQFELIGTAGSGLRAGNEPGSVVGGTGGEIGAGIFFDDGGTLGDGGILTVNVGWGSGNGPFTDLSSNVTNQHIHGPTLGNFGNDGTGNFKQTAAIPTGFGLTRTSASPSTGTIVNNAITFTAAQEADLFNGKFYINVHTANNTGGEVRGFLVVPEPSSAVLGAVGLVGLLGRRCRKA